MKYTGLMKIWSARDPDGVYGFSWTQGTYLPFASSRYALYLESNIAFFNIIYSSGRHAPHQQIRETLTSCPKTPRMPQDRTFYRSQHLSTNCRIRNNYFLSLHLIHRWWALFTLTVYPTRIHASTHSGYTFSLEFSLASHSCHSDAFSPEMKTVHALFLFCGTLDTFFKSIMGKWAVLGSHAKSGLGGSSTTQWTGCKLTT